MKNLNRFIVFSKRILSKKIFILMLTSIVLLTGMYKALPAKKQAADIRVAICNQDTSSYFESMYEFLLETNSLYDFYLVDSEDALIKDVKSGYAECGYVIPENFFYDYINGTSHTNAMIQYKLPSSTLAGAISESIFSCTLKACSGEILHFAVNMDEYREELDTRLLNYLNGDEVFTISDMTSGKIDYDTLIYHINIPVYEISLILTLFAGLLGLLMFIQDKEKGIYIVFSKKEAFETKSLSIITAIIPIAFTGIIASVIMFGFTTLIINILIFSVLTYIFALILNIFIKKSTLLSKVLPLIMLMSVIAVFVSSLM